MDEQTRTRRAYTSTRRNQQAEQTRSDVLAAAVRLFAQTGWAGTTLAAIAVEAGVAVETIYSGFPSKKALLKAAMEFAILGDTGPGPLLELDEAYRIRALPANQRLRPIFEWLRTIYHERLVGVWYAMLEGAASDPQIASWCEEHEQRRRGTVNQAMEMVCGRPVGPEVLDQIWALTSIEVYAKLTRQRDWNDEQWVDWITATTELWLN